MRYVPPYAMLKKWMASCASSDGTRLTPAYDDVLDVLKGFLQAIPVDEEWYKAEYPAIPVFLARMPTETATSHFQKHGYFEGRSPFAPGWHDLTAPVPFARLKTRLRIRPARGRLLADIAREDFLDLIKAILRAIPVDPLWYRSTYPNAARMIDDETFSSMTIHFVERGYVEGFYPFPVVVDEPWYVARYDHVRVGLERGVAKSAQDHFIRLGYNEGCRPTPP